VRELEEGIQWIPVVEDLAAKYVAPNAPAVCPAFFLEPVMAKELGVHVVDLKA
jgi:hypothetical protein